MQTQANVADYLGLSCSAAQSNIVQGAYANQLNPYTASLDPPREISNSEWWQLHKRVQAVELLVRALLADGFVDPGDA